MPKKIRLIDEPEAEETVEDTVEASEGTAEVTQEIYMKQFLKYAEAIDWKLWEILKLMRAEAEKK